jgi:hypothetical protein
VFKEDANEPAVNGENDMIDQDFLMWCLMRHRDGSQLIRTSRSLHGMTAHGRLQIMIEQSTGLGTQYRNILKTGIVDKVRSYQSVLL